MRTIALFYDCTPEALNAAMFALDIAEKSKVDIVVLSLCKTSSPDMLPVSTPCTEMDRKNEKNDIVSLLYDANPCGDFAPVITAIDLSDYTEKDICELVIRKNIWLMVKGIEQHLTHEALTRIDIQAIVNHVAAPLLLVPEHYAKVNFQNIIYTVDMRYCRAHVIGFLAELAKVYQSNLVIDHFSAKGLPHLGEAYAALLFERDIANKGSYKKILFNNIKERNLEAAVDVMVDDQHTDLLALVNHRFHFEELFGAAITNVLPEHIPVPVIVFPS